MQHVQDEADALADRHEADHDREHNRQQADDLIEHAVKHVRAHDAVQSGGSSSDSFLRLNPLS